MLKLCSRCGKATANRPAVCNECRLKEPETKREQNRYYDTKLRDPRAKAFYNSALWLRARAAYLSSVGYICEECKEDVLQGKRQNPRVATDVHHKEPISDNWERRLDFSNFQALCDAHHKGKRRKNSDRGGYGKV